MSVDRPDRRPIATDFICPSCDAQAGNACLDRYGNTRTPHVPRRRLAREATP